MDTATVRAEIKSWERAFRNEHGGDPTIDDIKAQPKIAAKYKLYKKLTKEASTNSSLRETHGSLPATLSRRTTASPGPSLFLPKSRPTTHSPTDSTVNPFSPAKSPRKKVADATRGSLDNPVAAKPPSTPPNKRRAFSTPSPEPFPLIEVSIPSPLINTAVKKARKRLRGDIVSPSPKKSRTVDGLEPSSPDSAESSNDNHEAESSYVEESPVKPSATGKDFKLLFEDESTIQPDFFGSGKRTSLSQSKSIFAPFDGVTNDERSLPGGAKTTKKARSIDRRSETLQSCIRPAERILRSASAWKEPYRPMKFNALKDTFGDNIGEARDTGVSSASHKRSSSEEATNHLNNSGFLPPSPPSRSSQTVQNRTGTTRQANPRKRTKMSADDHKSEGSTDGEPSLEIVDLDLRKHRTRQAESDEDDIFQEAFASPRKDRFSAVVDERENLSDRRELQVSLPEDLRKLLNISPSRTRAREEQALVASVLQGRPGPGHLRGEVWGVGEIEDATTTVTDGEDDWAGEGVAWEAAEL